MIRNFFTWIKGPHLFLFLIFLGTGIIIIGLSVRGYNENSQAEAGFADSYEIEQPELTFDDLSALFAESWESSPGGHEIVVRKNLFSPDREAWQPPPAKDEEGETQTSRPSRINQRDFRLYGITFSQGQKTALIYYHRFPENQRHHLASEGETVYDVQDHGTALYSIVSIGDESVTLESGGNTFEVGLFSHERQSFKGRSEDRISVAIGGTSESIEAAFQADAEVSDDQAGSQVSRQEEPDEQDQASVQPEEADPSGGGGFGAEDELSDDPDQRPTETRLDERLKEALQGAGQAGAQQHLYDEDMERRVEEGTMRRVDTIYGPIYRPVR